MALPRQRILALAMAFALLWSLVVATMAPAVRASEPVVSNLTITSVTVDPQTKVATVKGAVTCSGARRVEVFVEVSQTVGRLHTVTAGGDKRLDCDGRVRFTLKLTNFEGRLGPSEAAVRAGAFACSREACDFARFTEVMRVTNAS
jgi:hypothetical protein